jgi:hypothetical protein
MPPHRRKGFSALAIGLIASSLITIFIAGFMNSAEIPVTTILPTSAPIWVGFSTMLFMLLKE